MLRFAADAGPLNYRADPSALRIETPLDGLTLIYHRSSGQTHVVSEPLPEILSAMGEDVLDARAVLERLLERHEIRDGVEAVEARLAELCETGLLASISSPPRA